VQPSENTPPYRTPYRAALARELSLRTYLRQAAISALPWSAMVALEATRVLLSDATHAQVLPLFHYFIWAAFNWYTWALLTPAVLALVRRYPLTREKWAERILYPHLPACLVLVFVHAILRGLEGWIYTLFYEIHAPLSQLIAESLEKEGMWSVLAYCAVLAVVAYQQLRQEVQERTVREAQLQVRLASAELEKLRMQIQPHFLFNTLQAAIALVRDDPAAAEDVLLRLSELLRVALDNMGAQEVPLARELEFLDLYIGIQRQRFGDRLNFEIHADAATLNRQVPPLLLQPLVENAIRHGIGRHKGDDTVEIFARPERGGLELEVWNGNSVVEDEGERLFQRGVGLRNTRARLEYLYGQGASLVFRSNGKRGAVARIFIPALNGTAPAPRPAP
jgi:two-component system, LytTR family, sensor kinase